MRNGCYFKIVLAALFIIVVILVTKNRSTCDRNRPWEHRVNFEGEKREDRRKVETDLPCCKWDENLLGKDLDLAIIVLISIDDYSLLIPLIFISFTEE